MTARNPSGKVLVIGAGIGGLSISIFLAQQGYEVTVVEKNAQPGGLLRSYIRKGIECPVGVHYLGSLDRGQVLRSLFDALDVSDRIPLERMGANGIIDRYIFHDFTFDLPEGLDAFQDNLLSEFPDESKQIRAYMEMLNRSFQQLQSLEFLFAEYGAFEILDEIKPLGTILTELNCSRRLKSVLAVPSYWLGVPLDRSPSAYHSMSLASYLGSSWRLACSGSDMADVFAQSLQRAGGDILLGDRVESITLEADGAIHGVRLQSGRTLEAPMVVGAIHPKRVLSLLPPRTLRPVYKNRILKLADTRGLVAVHAAVDASAHPEIPHNLFEIETDRNRVITDVYYIQVRKSSRPGKNILSVLAGGNADMWVPWKDTVTGRRGEDYLRVKEQEARRILVRTESILGKLHDPEILDVFTPLTIRDWVNSPGGSAYGVLHSTDQLQAVAILNRYLIPGLHFAGQNVLAPGVLGTILGSLHTVKSIIGPDKFKKAFPL